MKRHVMQVVEHGDGIFVTRDGRVFSNRQGRFKEKKQRPHWKGYLQVHIGRLHAQRSIYVHRLVLQAFDGDRPGMVCMHLNNDRRDNRIENLRWGTPKENSEQMVRENRQHKPSRPWIVIEARNSKLSNAELARKHGVDPSYISHIRAGRRGCQVK